MRIQASLVAPLCAGAVIVGLVAARPASTGAEDADRSQSFHGAASMEEQLAALAELGLAEEGITPPAGVDPRVWTASILPGNEPTKERVDLGRELYFDTRLSRDGTVACATCHDVTRGFTDQRPVSEGVDGQLGRRNAPTTMNAMLFVDQFWDGRAENVEDQAGMPILNPIEMGFGTEAEVVAHVKEIGEYGEAFREAYGRDVAYEDIQNAIGAFERTLVFLDAPFDRWQAGDEDAVSESVKRGFELFEGKGRCSTCHTLNRANPLGTDNSYHNIGVAARNRDFESLALRALDALEEDPSEQKLDELALSTDMSELGRFMVTKNYSDVGAFKTEQLRNVGITAPYMHDGSMQTLWDVMDHYNKGGEDNAYLDGGIEALALTEEEIDDLVAFMFALTDVRFSEENRAAMEAQREKASKSRPFREPDLAQREVLGFERRVLGTEKKAGGK